MNFVSVFQFFVFSHTLFSFSRNIVSYNLGFLTMNYSENIKLLVHHKKDARMRWVEKKKSRNRYPQCVALARLVLFKFSAIFGERDLTTDNRISIGVIFNHLIVPTFEENRKFMLCDFFYSVNFCRSKK